MTTPITLADIARAIGVSSMTVSRAINDHPAINAETRTRILEVARQMNYKPNTHARALKTNRSHLLGFIVPDLMHSYYAEILHGMEAVARPAGYQILICNTGEDATREIGEVEALLQRTDGLVIASVLPPNETKHYRRMLKADAKITLIDRRLEGLRCTAVMTDNLRVGRLATEHLLELGHRRIGHLRGTNATVSIERFEGYRQALADHKIKLDERLVRDCGFLEEEGYDAMRRWLNGGDLPTAVFAANDSTAIGAMHAIDEAGLRVGGDIAIVGAGNIHYGDMLKVPLTTVSWEKHRMGAEAARSLLAAIEGTPKSKHARHIIVEPELVVRHSSGASRGS